MGVITILQNFTFVAAVGQSFNTPWIPFPAEHQLAQINITVKTAISGTLQATMQTTFDTDSQTTVGTIMTAAAQGTTLQDVSTGIGPMIRFNLAGTVANTIMIISVYVTPKCN